MGGLRMTREFDERRATTQCLEVSVAFLRGVQRALSTAREPLYVRLRTYTSKSCGMPRVEVVKCVPPAFRPCVAISEGSRGGAQN